VCEQQVTSVILRLVFFTIRIDIFIFYTQAFVPINTIIMLTKSVLILIILGIIFRCETAATKDVQIKHPIWPMPKHIQIHGKDEVVKISSAFKFVVSQQKNNNLVVPSVLINGMKRYETLVNKKVSLSTALSKEKIATSVSFAEVYVHDNFESAKALPNINTNYEYAIKLRNGKIAIEATSVYGAMYGMESLLQLIDRTTGTIVGNNIEIIDNPDYAWRGLMIDSGRRFFPMSLVKDLLDTMASVKLNVLHLHASDMCRFGVESKVFPNLTEALTGMHAGFYTQKDIADMIVYAGQRGIRVVPEFDVPGHSRGLRPIKSKGVVFCSDDESQNQLYGDPNNSTYNTIHELMKEMAALFSDDVFNIGCDETAVKNKCTLNSTFEFERTLLKAIQNEFKKTPEGWEEILYDADAATADTIVNAWARHNASEIVKTGRKAVESKEEWFYFTEAAKGGPDGWTPCWNDIGLGVPENAKHLLLGGEISMWSDTYCFSDQCGAFGPDKPVPVGSALFDPKYDAEFSKSIGGMIWPRGFVAANAFWHYNASISASSPDFVVGIYNVNDEITSRGLPTCPSKCDCDQLTACGNPYIKK
jgi:hexosaminidase